MKKFAFIFFAAVAALVACNPDEEVNKDKEEKADYSKLVINEVNAIAGEDAGKFVEFYNTGDKPISMEGVVIKRTDETNAVDDVWLGLSGEVCPAKGFFVIQGTKNSLERSLSKGVSAKKGVRLEAFDPDGKAFASVQHGDPTNAEVEIEITSGIWARIPDGGAWKNVTNETPGKANDATGAKDDSQLK